MAFEDDLNNLHNPATNTSPPASFGDAVVANFKCVERVIAHTVLGSAASSISSGTLATVTNGWRLRVLFRGQNSGGTAVDVHLRFNSDSGTNYSRQYLVGSSTTASAASETGVNSIKATTTGNESANRWSTFEATVFDYLGSGHKSVQVLTWDPRNLSACLIMNVGGLWASTSAITSVSVTSNANNFVTGSSLTILATPSI